MNRRGFLGSIIALAAAPAIVRADSLMRVRDPYPARLFGLCGPGDATVESEILTAGDGWHHFAITRQAGKFVGYIDGVAARPDARDVFERMRAAQVDKMLALYAPTFDGLPPGHPWPAIIQAIDELRVTDGVIRYGG